MSNIKKAIERKYPLYAVVPCGDPLPSHMVDLQVLAPSLTVAEAEHIAREHNELVRALTEMADLLAEALPHLPGAREAMLAGLEP